MINYTFYIFYNYSLDIVSFAHFFTKALCNVVKAQRQKEEPSTISKEISHKKA